MAQTKRFIFRNIIGDTKATIDAIQRYIAENAPKTVNDVQMEIEEAPAESINRVLKAAECEDTKKDIADFLRKI